MLNLNNFQRLWNVAMNKRKVRVIISKVTVNIFIRVSQGGSFNRSQIGLFSDCVNVGAVT